MCRKFNHKEKHMPLSREEAAKPAAAVHGAVERSKGPGGTLIGNEYCNMCGGDMGFPINTHVDDPVRFKDQAYYREGAGQTCGDCEKTTLK